MYLSEFYVIYPDGDNQEIDGRLRVGELVDVNGIPLDLPLPSCRTLAYRVARISTKESRGGSETFHYLELMSAEELEPYARS